MRKVTNIYEARVPVTHYQGESKAEWVVRVNKVGRTYSVVGMEGGFSNIDNRIIRAIFEPYVKLLRDMFYDCAKRKTITKNAAWACIGSANTYLTGVKNEDTAVQIGKWLEAVARAAIESIPSHELDRSLVLYKDVNVKAIEMARAYSSKDKLTQ